MRVFGLTGWSGSGKTTLMARLIPALNGLGFSVSTVKHAHHGFEVDKPGKDSHTHRLAGAHEVLISSSKRWALMHENRDQGEAELATLLPHLSAVDLVLIEGFKNQGHDKLEILRYGSDRPLLYDDDPTVVVVASDHPVPDCPVPVLELDDTAAIARFILTHCKLAQQ